MKGQQQRQQATNLNNSAVVLLQMDRPSEAMGAWRQAASALQETSGTSSIKNSSSLGSDPIYCQGNSPLILPVMIYRTQTPTPYPRDDSLREYIYDQALTISNSSQNDEVISATILYNVALLHHLKGIDQGKCVYLNKALRLYQTALVILARCDDDSLSTSSIRHGITLLWLALLNNSAQIHLHLFQPECLDESLCYIRFILNDASIINAASSSRDDNEEGDYNYYSFFFLNTMICSGFNIAPAA
jgi:hypothetical protein